MKKIWLICLFTLAGLPIAAQDIVYYNLKGFFAHSGDTIAAIRVEKRAKNQIVLTGGADYRLSVDKNETLCRYLKKRSFLVKVDSALYVNCRKLRYKKLRFGAWFAPAMELNGHIYFSAIPIGTVAAGPSSTMDVMLGGTLGDAIAASVQVKKRVYYEIDGTTGKVDFVGKEKMSALLSNQPEWKEDYLNADSESAELTGKYLWMLKRSKK
ncbi:MAG: DUF6563 family protein [Bacteroides sp.]